jgi:hypothetical protein
MSGYTVLRQACARTSPANVAASITQIAHEPSWVKANWAAPSES